MSCGILRRRIPDRLVVATFDDAVSTDFSFVGPLLKKYGFGGTFFVCEFPPDFADKHKYMSWEQIKSLNDMGFEIGNHTGTHAHVTHLTKAQFAEQLEITENRCRQYGIPQPTSFAYPGYATNSMAVEVLAAKGYLFARAGQDRPYQPLADNPLLIPGFTTYNTNEDQIMGALQQAKGGAIVVLTTHGVPDYAHSWVTLSPELFEKYLKFMKAHRYKVIAMRDLARYIDPIEAGGRTAVV
jgi:peptidoglycan/xylan/chitin deacetylase (PgdA/CDA1 family)